MSKNVHAMANFLSSERERPMNTIFVLYFAVLKLNSPVYVTGFTLEHIPKTLSPNGRIDSAPRNFTVWVSKLQLIFYEGYLSHFLCVLGFG